MNIIEARNLSRDFKVGNNTVHALRNVDIDICENKFTVLKGRSGSGKTTLINLLGMLDTPTSGVIKFRNQIVNDLSENKRDELRRGKVGFVFQAVALISLMTVYENVEFAMRVSDYNPKERHERAVECLKAVGLENRMKHMVYELSGGEQQRVAIARALAHKPEIIFADEPTAELDSAMAKHIVNIFKNIVDEGKTTIIMTTHDISLTKMANKIYTLGDGEVINIEG